MMSFMSFAQVLTVGVLSALSSVAMAVPAVPTAMLDQIMKSEIESETVLTEINAKIRKKAGKLLTCRNITYGNSIATTVAIDIDGDGRKEAVPGVTLFVYLWLRGDADNFGPDIEGGIHILLATSAVVRTDDNGRPKFEILTTQIADRRIRSQNTALLRKIPVIDKVHGGLVNFISRLVEQKMGNHLDGAADGLNVKLREFALPAKIFVQFTTETEPLGAATFKSLGNQSVQHVGGADACNAVFVVTLFTNDLAFYRVLKAADSDGVATRGEFKNVWRIFRRKGGATTSDNDREDIKTPGKHMVTIYIPRGRPIDLKDVVIPGAGKGWRNRAASVWIQPGPSYRGEKLTLTDGLPGDGSGRRTLTLEPGFHHIINDKIREEASGMIAE